MSDIINQKEEDMKLLDSIHTLINTATETEENKFLDSLPSNNGIEESNDESLIPVTEKAAVSVDPVTGNYTQIAKELNITEDMAKMLEFNEDDIIKIPGSKYELEFNEEVLKNNIMSTLNTKDVELVSDLLDVILRYRKADVFRESTNWYELLPKKIKSIIDKQCFNLNNTAMSTKKMLAKELLEEIISSSSIDQIAIDMQESLSTAFDTSNIMTYVLEENMTTFEKKIEDLIEKDKSIKLDDPEKDKKRIEHIELLTKIQHQYREAYTLEGFINAIEHGKVRVKPFDISKYKRFVEQFYWKYEQDTPFTIQDPTRVPPILVRKFPQFTPDQCVAFIIGFFKYTANMKANDVVDHTFMSYFISNILQLDLIKHLAEEGDFINILSNNIEKALYAINNIKYKKESEESNNE